MSGNAGTGARKGRSALAGLLRTWRERALLTQEQLAARTGLGVRTIRRLESDDCRRPHKQSLRLIADALDLTEAERGQLTAASVTPSLTTPRQLPAPPQPFTGRTLELDRLTSCWDHAAVVVAVIEGMAGIGKTALALAAAHSIADRYPDGQLFVDLRGYSAGTAPMEPGDVLDRFLRALGLAGERIPADADERAALYRSTLAGRQMLVVLDNAATERQVQPLLPGAPGCQVLVTSRRRLPGLDQTLTISLDVLASHDAIALFTGTVGGQRSRDLASKSVGEIVELCGRLPLAIRLAAARFRAHPAWTVTHLAERLSDQRRRLAELEAGQRSVTAALDLSYRQLAEEAQRLYQLLGTTPGTDVAECAAAALTGTTVDHLRRGLDELAYVHLVHEHAVGRFVLHDLVREHAAGIAARTMTEPAQSAGQRRLLDYYRYAASSAMDIAYPYERDRRPRIPTAGPPTPDLSDSAQSVAWLDRELPNLLAATRFAAERGWPEYTWHFSTILQRHLRTCGRYHQAEALHQLALSTARAAGHPAHQVDALTSLGHIDVLRGHNQQAAKLLSQAAKIARASGYQAGELEALTGLGWVHLLQARYPEATDHYSQSLRIARGAGNEASAVIALNGLGQVYERQGAYARAIDHFEQALQIARDTGNHTGELAALAALGMVLRRQGRYTDAAERVGQALQIARTIGNLAGELVALSILGRIHLRHGRYARAADHFGRLLSIAQATEDQNFEFEAQQGMGRLQLAAGRPAAAISHHHQALALAGDLGQPADQARAHDGLAHAYHSLGDRQRASEHWRHTLAILTGLGVDRVDDEETTTANIRARLAVLDPESPQVGGDQ